ncbi:MAG: GNAT family N-acetyltransferase [Alphaproteobacteria bacterium]|nr:GNAT family N-acetyltransferase [Alphaproteobacteria bacterium]
MELVTPDKKYKSSYVAALKEGFYSGSKSPISQEEIAEIEKDFDTYLATKILKPYNPTPKLRDNGKYYPNVPQIPYWLVDNKQFIGAFFLRTELNEFLMYVGGNVGYGITPRFRQMGYATKGLALLILKAQELGMKKLLIAAKDNNIGSWKAIEKNGGILENIITLPWESNGQKYRRYRIEIVKSGS